MNLYIAMVKPAKYKHNASICTVKAHNDLHAYKKIHSMYRRQTGKPAKKVYLKVIPSDNFVHRFWSVD